MLGKSELICDVLPYHQVLSVLSQLDRMHEFASGRPLNDLLDDPHNHGTDATAAPSTITSAVDAKV